MLTTLPSHLPLTIFLLLRGPPSLPATVRGLPLSKSALPSCCESASPWLASWGPGPSPNRGVLETGRGRFIVYLFTHHPVTELFSGLSAGLVVMGRSSQCVWEAQSTSKWSCVQCWVLGIRHTQMRGCLTDDSGRLCFLRKGDLQD